MSPGGWLALIVVVIALVGFVKLVRKREITDERFAIESRRPSLLRAGLLEIQGFLEPEKRAALQVVEDEKRKTDLTVCGEPPRPR